MSGNSFGKNFVVTTCGESHGPALMAIVDGCPPGLPLSEPDLQADINRRKTGQSRYTSQRREPDAIQILSGVFEGVTTGTSIGLLIQNEDHRSRDYTAIKDTFRPGHADYTYQKKYGVRDYRGGGRSSARETVMRVAAGAIAKKYLQTQLGITIQGYVSAVGDIVAERVDLPQVEQNPFFFPDIDKLPALAEKIQQCLRDGDSVGAEVRVIATSVPVGLGEPVFDKLDASLASALMGINAVKAVAIGDGAQALQEPGSQFRDELTSSGFLTNHAGGILGGISSGQSITASCIFKPTSSIRVPGASITREGESTTVVTTGRHDPCVGIRAVPIVEAMVALVLIDHYLRDRAQNGAVIR